MGTDRDGRRPRRARGIAANLALLAATLVVLVLAAEVGLRLFGTRRGDWYAAGPERLVFLRDHVRRNAQGFRDREFSAAPTPSTHRILAVGDSFTFGDGIPRVEDTWPRVLERLLAASGIAAEVLNLGVPGTNTSFQRRLLLEKGYRLQPERIVLGFVLNDPEPPGANREIVPSRLFLPLIPWRSADALMTRASYGYAWARGKKNQILERFGWKETYDDYVHSLFRPGPEWDAFVAEAHGLVEDATARRVAVTVALFPMFHDLEKEPFARETAQAAEVFREAGAEVIDLMEIYRGKPTADLCISPTNAHPDEQAHRLAAEAIARRLESEMSKGR